MERLAAAGTFALLAGAATLLLLASIFYSCRVGGEPHEMGNEPPADKENPAHSRVEERPAPHTDGYGSDPSVEPIVVSG